MNTMFKKIIVRRDERGVFMAQHRELTMEKANCSGFYIYNHTQRDVPMLQVRRALPQKLIKKDPWNDDGQPPTTLFMLAYPTVKFGGDYIEVIGFEQPNMCMAGIMREPYKAQLTPWADQMEERRFFDTENPIIYPQHIILSCKP